jgi:hypothetical protein
MSAGYLSATNKSPYSRNPFHGGLEPQTICLYYANEIVEDQEPVPRAYIIRCAQPIRNKVQLGELIEDAAQKAFDEDIEPDGIGFDTFEWRHKSVVAILIDVDGWGISGRPWRRPGAVPVGAGRAVIAVTGSAVSLP